MNVNAPRYLFFYYGGKTANTYFPLGSGFATFGSDQAARNYSRLYYQYGFNSLFGMNTEDGSFLSDTFWPMAIGQFGWIGSILYILIYVRIFFSFKWMDLNLEQKALLYAGYMQYIIHAVLSMFQQIFNQAWTISAVKEYDQDSSEFYSTIYKAYNMCMVITCAGLILFDKVIAKILFGADFYEAWKYAPFLMISVVFGALVQLLGGIFSAAKESKAFGNTILIGAAANTIMNVAFVYACGPLGAAIATSLSYMLIWALRLYKVTRQMKLDVSLIRDALSYVLLYLQATLLMFYSYNWSGYLIQIGFVVAIFVLYFKELTGVARKVLSRVKSR